jgi:1-acyl-sn-glycerol-3-phosphate acyltransferase
LTTTSNPQPLRLSVVIPVHNGQATLARLYGGIPIHRGEVDRDAMQQMLAALRAGFPLMVSPEGGRSHVPGLRQAKPGVAYILERTGVPVVPVGVVGTTDDFFMRASRGERPRLEMHVGQAFTLPKVDESGLHPREKRQHIVDYIMRRMAALLPASYRGVYDSPAAHIPTKSAQATF